MADRDGNDRCLAEKNVSIAFILPSTRWRDVAESLGMEITSCLCQWLWGASPRHPKQLDEPLLVVDGANFGAENPVEDFGDGEGKRKSDDHEDLGQPDGVRPDCQTVTRANGLEASSVARCSN